MSEAMNEKQECRWRQDGVGEDAYDTSCHQRFVLNEGTPAENKMRYCCYCGGTLITVLEKDQLIRCVLDGRALAETVQRLERLIVRGLWEGEEADEKQLQGILEASEDYQQAERFLNEWQEEV